MDKKLVKLIKEQEKQNFPQNEINKIDYIIEKAYKKGMCIIFNPSPYNDEIKNLDFNMLSYIILKRKDFFLLMRCV